MNLRMPKSTIDRLAERGGEAAKEYRKFDFDLHRWHRYRIATNELDILLSDLHGRYQPAIGSGYRTFIRDYGTTSHNPGTEWGQHDFANTEQLMNVAASWAREHFARRDAPSPSPVLRLESRQLESG